MKKITLISLICLSISTSCNWNKAQKGAAIGTGAGAATGAVIGNRLGSTAAGAIIGAAIGGASGALIGRYMDKQAEELRNDMKNATVERVGEGIKITFDSGLLFTTNSHSLSSNSKQNLDDLSRILKKYKDTQILIEGHTDNAGTKEYNQTLSEKRAAAVSNFLRMGGVTDTRISSYGYGENQSIEENTTEAGKALNRRVEVAIFANKKLVRAAQKGEI